MAKKIKMGIHKIGLFMFSVLLGSTVFSAPVQLIVDVKDETPGAAANARVSGVAVVAVRFGNTGPGADSIVVTDVEDGTEDGLVHITFSDQQQNKSYDIFATKHGYGPTLINQAFKPDHPHVFVNTTVNNTTSTIRMTTLLTDRGIIIATVTNATPNSMVFGNVRKVSTSKDVAFSGCETDGSGTCYLRIENVPAANPDLPANTYDVSAFDPGKGDNGQGNGGQLAATLGIDEMAYTSIDIDQGLPPDFSANAGDRTQEQDRRETQTAGGGEVEGIIYEVNIPSMTVPHSGISLRVVQNNQEFDRYWSNADQNGRFRFFGLEVGTTYYVRAFGGCRFQGNNACYDGWESSGTRNNGTLMSPNDFVYVSSSPNLIRYGNGSTSSIIKIQLARAPAGTASLKVYVKDEAGRAMPGSGVNIWPDGNPWHTNPSTPICSNDPQNWYHQGVDDSRPGFSNQNVQATTGYALLTGLRPGNYTVQVWTSFGNNRGTSFNGGPDGRWEWGSQNGNNHRGCFEGSEDDYRLSISSVDGSFSVYNTSGSLVSAYIGASSITVVVPTVKGSSARVHGTLTFPQVVDLSNDPITIVLRGGCGQHGCTGNFDVIGDNEAPAAVYNYSVDVSSVTVVDEDQEGGPPQEGEMGSVNAASYWAEIKSNYWGMVRAGGGEQQIIFNGTDTVRRDYKFAPAGRVMGTLYKPDGSKFIPGNTENGYVSAGINFRGLSVDAWGHAELLQDGTFIGGGLLPGEYSLEPELHSGGTSGPSYSQAEPADRVVVKAGVDSSKDVKFVEGELVLVEMATTTLPALRTTVDPDDIGRGFKGEIWEAQRLPAGTPFTQDVLSQVLDEGFGENSRFFMVPAGNSGPCGPGDTARWCPRRVPSNGAIDVHMFRRGNLDMVGNDEIYMYLTIVASTKNVIIDSNHRSDPQIAYQSNTPNTRPVRVRFSPEGITSGVTVEGTVTAANIFRQVDFESFGGSFENFIKYIPIVALYESDGKLRAAGFVTPPASVVGDHNGDPNNAGNQIDRAVTTGDWEAFKTATAGLTWKYQIRGVPPGKTYSMVATTPNYPPFSAKIDAGVNGSTATQNINWDSADHIPATIKGSVKIDLSSAALANASVEVKAPGVKTRTLITDEDGEYVTEGLPKGLYKIRVSASGYAPQTVDREVLSGATTTINFRMTVASGTITGTVRELSFTSRGPVIKPVSGADVFAYDDTVNVNSPESPLALIKTQTGSDGTYSLEGLIDGHQIRIFLKAPGRYIQDQSTIASTANMDFNLDQKPLDIEVFARPNFRDDIYEISILNPNNFEDGAIWWGPVANVKANQFGDDDIDELPDGSIRATIPLSVLRATTTTTFILHIEAEPSNGDPTVTKEIEFGLRVEGNAQESIDDELIGDDSTDDAGRPENRVSVDEEGDGTSIDIPVGSIINGSGEELPILTVTEESTSTLTGGQLDFDGEFKGGVVELGFDNVNFTSRTLTLNLAFDPGNVNPDELAEMKVYHYDTASGEWEEIDGQLTIDPLNGVVSVPIDPNAQIVAQVPLSPAPGIRGSSAVRSRSMAALRTEKGFARNALAAASGSGIFALAIPASTGTVNTSNTYKQYNFPNPFNLLNKTVTFINGTGTNASPNIRGTYIVLTPTSDGIAKIRIYNVAGDMVRELEYSVTGGQYNYIPWDGKNTSGDDIASGVYFATVDAPGSDKKEPIKMVVVK